jgi:hypothetical protein
MSFRNFQTASSNSASSASQAAPVQVSADFADGCEQLANAHAGRQVGKCAQVIQHFLSEFARFS